MDPVSHVHAVLPAGEVERAGQSVQGRLPAGPKEPALHLHALNAVLAAGESELVGQRVQAPLPSTGL